MEKNLRWLNREFKKDEKEILATKKDFIKQILKTEKKEITKGATKINKESIWKKILKKLTGL